MTRRTRDFLRGLAWLVWKPIWLALCIGIAVFEALARKGLKLRIGK